MRAPAKKAAAKTRPAPAKAARAETTPTETTPTENATIQAAQIAATAVGAQEVAAPIGVTSAEPAQADAAAAAPTAVDAAQAGPREIGDVRATAGSGGETDAWTRLLADPRHAPELLALAAVQTIGPRARDWAERTRAAYPAASDRALARLATQQFTRASSPGGLLGAVAGAVAPGVLLGTAAVRHAELTLHLAAAYGKDPTDPQRAAELLEIVAEVAGRRRLGRMILGQASAWTVARLMSRYFPGTGLLAAFLTANAATEAVAARANAFYRARSNAVKAT